MIMHKSFVFGVHEYILITSLTCKHTVRSMCGLIVFCPNLLSRFLLMAMLLVVGIPCPYILQIAMPLVINV